MPVKKANPFGKKMSKEAMQEILSRLLELEEMNGYRFLRDVKLKEAEDLMKNLGEIRDDSFETLNRINRNIHTADAIVGVFQWMEDAIAYCKEAIDGGGR